MRDVMFSLDTRLVQNDLPTYPFIIVAALLTLLGAVWVQRFIARRTARQIFRERMIEGLSGFYPKPGNWDRGFETRLQAALDSIGPEVQKFRFHVPMFRRRAFDAAWDRFRSHATTMNWEACAAFVMYPTMRSESARNPKDVFYDEVERMLSFARET